MQLVLLFTPVFLILFFGFFETLVFNDEIFLALCFTTFLFFAYSCLNSLFYSSLRDRAKAHETALFFSYKNELFHILADSSGALFGSRVWAGVAYNLPTVYGCYTTASCLKLRNSLHLSFFGGCTSCFLENHALELKNLVMVNESCLAACLLRAPQKRSNLTFIWRFCHGVFIEL